MEGLLDVAQDVVAPPTRRRVIGGTVRGFHPRRLGSVDGGQIAQSRRRVRRRAQDDLELRAIRAERLVQVGELSSACQALEGAPLAPGNQATLRQFTDASRRPPQPRGTVATRSAEPCSTGGRTFGHDV